MSLVLIDSCAWIDFFRYQESDLGNKVASLIKNDQAAITGVVVAELLQGIKSSKQQQQVEQMIRSVSYLDMKEFDWINSGKLLMELRSKGVTLPLTDALIAIIAQRHQVSVLTIDKHFQHLPVKCY